MDNSAFVWTKTAQMHEPLCDNSRSWYEETLLTKESLDALSLH